MTDKHYLMINLTSQVCLLLTNIISKTKKHTRQKVLCKTNIGLTEMASKGNGRRFLRLVIGNAEEFCLYLKMSRGMGKPTIFIKQMS